MFTIKCFDGATVHEFVTTFDNMAFFIYVLSKSPEIKQILISGRSKKDVAHLGIISEKIVDNFVFLEV